VLAFTGFDLHRPTLDLDSFSLPPRSARHSRDRSSCPVASSVWQGLKIVHRSAQSEPCLSLTDWRHPAYALKCAYVELRKWTSVSPCRLGQGEREHGVGARRPLVHRSRRPPLLRVARVVGFRVEG